MSIKSWKNEFYPIAASRVAKKNALAHSLKKWKGLTRENLVKHKLMYCHRYIHEGKSFRFTKPFMEIDGGSCACCHHWIGKSRSGAFNIFCQECPLLKARGGFRCDQSTDYNGDDPYGAFINNGNPNPMIKLIKLAINKNL